VSWRDGAFTFESGHGSLGISNRLQFRFTQELPDDREQLAGTEAPGEGRGSFRIRRAKTALFGWVWNKDLTYELQIGWAAADSGPGGTFSGLEDGFLNWDVSHDKRFMLRAGQFKVPFGRQEMTSSENLQFVDRDILSFEFTHSRDVGVAVLGQLAHGKLDYRAGIFNGNQRNRPNNDNAKYQYDARLTFQPWGDVKYSEGDFESKDKPLLAVSAGFESNDLTGVTNATDFKNTIFGSDVVFKYRGFSLFGEYFARERTPERGQSFNSNGYHVQAGYFVKRNKAELAFRYAGWDPSDAVAENDRREIGGAFNYFINKHPLKLQADFRQLEDDARDTKDRELRLQFQVAF
jgi:phosphate-selective porin